MFNFKDFGVDVIVGLCVGFIFWKKVENLGFKVVEVFVVVV